MKQSYYRFKIQPGKAFSVLLFCLFVIPLFNTIQAQIIERDDMIIAPAPATGSVCTLDPTNVDAHYYIRHEDVTAKWLSEVRTADFEMTYFENCGGQTWPQQAVQAFEYAANIWASHLNSSIPIRVEANWVAQEENTLGSAGPTRIVQLTGAVDNTWYSIAQGSAMTGQDIVADIADEDFDIAVNMNCSFNDWYFGLDANPPAGQIDFVTVVLHELGHGIGFLGSMQGDEDAEIAEYGRGENNFPFIYDRSVEDGNENSILNTSIYPNPSQQLYQALTGQRNGLFFTGTDATSVNAGNAVRLFSPNPWEPGSSYSHVDQVVFSNSENALMRPRVDRAFAIHTPGPVVCGMLSDWGWPLGGSCLALVGAESFIAISETSLDFGVTNVGTSVERTFEISNEETAEDPLNYNVGVESSSYIVIPVQAASGRLDPGESITITIRYSPGNDRIHKAEARISHNAMNASSPLIVSLEGEALRADEIARLEQNYPNPFNPATTIPYILSETSTVRLEVYSMAGQLVQTLVTEQQPEGRYEYPVDGSGLSSGVYLYRLIVDDFADTKKFLLVK